MLADGIAVEDLDAESAIDQPLPNVRGDRGFPGAREARQPDHAAGRARDPRLARWPAPSERLRSRRVERG